MLQKIRSGKIPLVYSAVTNLVIIAHQLQHGPSLHCYFSLYVVETIFIVNGDPALIYSFLKSPGRHFLIWFRITVCYHLFDRTAKFFDSRQLWRSGGHVLSRPLFSL